jgi:hypothetical protein
VDIWSLGLVFLQIVFLLNFQGLAAFLKRVGLLDPDIVLRKARIGNLAVEVRALMVERFGLREVHVSSTASSSAVGALGGVHGEVMAILDVMLQPEQVRSSAATILASYTPTAWKNDYKKISMFIFISFGFISTSIFSLFLLFPNSSASSNFLDSLFQSPSKKKIATVDTSEEIFTPQKIPNIAYRPADDVAVIEYGERIGLGSFGQVSQSMMSCFALFGVLNFRFTKPRRNLTMMYSLLKKFRGIRWIYHCFRKC